MSTASLYSHYSKLLMCSPDHFCIKYEINPWMLGNIDYLDKMEAEKQWYNLYDHIQLHTEVQVIESIKGLPDMVFIANAALIIGNKCMVATFKYPERQGETLHWHSWFVSHGYDAFLLSDTLFFEGEGDALYDRERQCIWAGYSKRSHRSAYEKVGAFFDIEVVYIELIDDYFYHLDTCVSVLPGGYILYVPEVLSEQSCNNIEERVPRNKQISITRSEAEHFSCNVVAINDIIICNAMSQRIKDILSEKGFRIQETPLTEFIKAGGAAKCLVLTPYIQ